MHKIVDLPVIDLHAGNPCDEATLLKTAHGVWDALSTNGFFYIRNHGVPADLIQRMRALYARFFAQPLEDKLAIKGSVMRGYNTLLELAVGADFAEDGAIIHRDMCERLTVGPEIPERVRAAEPYYQTPFAQVMLPPNLWPAASSLPGFQETALEYYRAMEHLFHHLMSLIARAADLPGEFWKPFFTRHCGALTGIGYPEPPAELCRPDVERMGAHEDGTMLTILYHENLANEEGHLQIKCDGEWRAAPAREGAFLVNIGQLLEKITNGRLKASRHRVVMPEKPEGSHRLSIVFYCNPNHDAVFEVLSSCVPEGQKPRRFDYQAYVSEYLAKATA
ncbi:MAG TPA: 2-oxoglutarate and iron-dependent oxygenase domain-containing protein [Archangium sp.]|nr:2-oxoglutarate and iron-dependent oxygenase domain-containing protein [Archangium sp.]